MTPTSTMIKSTLFKWGFPQVEAEISLSPLVKKYLDEFQDSFPNSKNLLIFGSGHRILNVITNISYKLLEANKIVRRISLLNTADMLAYNTRPEEITQRILTGDLTILTEIGLAAFSNPQLINLYGYIAEPLLKGHKFIFTSSNTAVETAKNLNKPLIDLIQGTTNAVDIGK